MSYVPNFANDVFVSYSTNENEVLVFDGERRRGWVDMLLEKLRPELKSLLGVRDVSFYVDHELMRSNLPITPQILDAVRGSATLLLVMSPSYLASEWCRRERNAFLSVVRDRVATGAVFVVRARRVVREEQPEELRDLRGIEFHTSGPGAASSRLLGSLDGNDTAFADRVMTLAAELSEQLRRLRAPADSGGDPPPTGERVFVAAATDDVEEREAELRTYLKQAGLDVRPSPQSRYPETDLAAYEAAVLQELAGCCLFAQILGAARGKELSFAPGKRLPGLQHDLARRAQKPVLQRRERDLAFDTVHDPEHRALLEGAQACGIEEFKRAVSERAHQKPTKEANRQLQVSVVFVNADSPDRGLAVDLGKALAGLGVDCYWPIEEGPPEAIRADMEDNLRTCDGLVLIYGKTRLSWVQSQLRQTRKVLSTRGRPISTMAIFQGPPLEKPEIAAAIPNLVILDCRQGLDPDKIREFVGRLRA